MVNSNAKSVFLMSGAVVPAMMQQGEGGRIINIGATGGLKGAKIRQLIVCPNPPFFV